jgi:hypothetical protein
MKILDMIDNFIRKYIGFDKQEIIPHTLKKAGNKFFLINTESFKRHVYHEKWDKFLSRNFKEASESTKQKIGLSMGKSIAKNLVISFENISIKKEEK